MSNLSVKNIVNPTTADTTPTDNLSKQVCKAWVNFDGTGVPTIRDSYNVASITDNGIGDYTINFSTPMNDTNYTFSGGVLQYAANYGMTTPLISKSNASTRFQVFIHSTNRAKADVSDISVQIFGS